MKGFSPLKMETSSCSTSNFTYHSKHQKQNHTFPVLYLIYTNTKPCRVLSNHCEG